MALSYGFALTATDNSADFANALSAVTGDGIAKKGGKFSFAVNGFTVTLSSGYAYAAGRYVENDEPYTMTVGPPGNNDDRVDAIAARVDYEARKAALEIIANVDPVKIRQDPSILRDGNQYCIILYLINAKRGSTSLSPSDITDLRADKNLCGVVAPLSDISKDVIYVYSFLNGGIDAEVARLISLSNAVIAKADAAIVELDATIKASGGGAGIGELMTSRRSPGESGWILCNGTAVPSGYAALSALLGGTLPDISNESDRYKTYIYGGAPAEV